MSEPVTLSEADEAFANSDLAMAVWHLVAAAGVADPLKACHLAGAIMMVLGSHFAGPELERAHAGCHRRRGKGVPRLDQRTGGELGHAVTGSARRVSSCCRHCKGDDGGETHRLVADLKLRPHRHA